MLIAESEEQARPAITNFKWCLSLEQSAVQVSKCNRRMWPSLSLLPAQDLHFLVYFPFTTIYFKHYLWDHLTMCKILNPVALMQGPEIQLSLQKAWILILLLLDIDVQHSLQGFHSVIVSDEARNHKARQIRAGYVCCSMRFPGLYSLVRWDSRFYTSCKGCNYQSVGFRAHTSW